ncbi:hypothetical protein [Roseibium sp.]|uniref:hypothetical protein n=1 Tax=Roseibium sp. TaxID=1936156 RepID=UPI003A972499
MRIEPIKTLGRSNLKQRRRREDNREQLREERPFQVQVIVTDNPVEQDHDRFVARYRPNSTFLAHLIATRDGDPQTRFKRQTEPEIGSSRYRETAASPRKRSVGHVIALEF